MNHTGKTIGEDKFGEHAKVIKNLANMLKSIKITS